MTVEFFQNGEGRLSYEDSHTEGPLVVLMAPMGATRSVYRFVAPTLASEGYRVVTLDLRGHGQSSTGWSEYTIAAHGKDLLALIRSLDTGPACVVGNSFSGGVAVWAAVEDPASVQGIALVGAFVRKIDVNPIMGALMGVALAGPWGPSAWMAYYPSMYPTRQPDDFEAHLAQTKQNMRETGRFSAFRKIAAAPKYESEERLAQVSVPALVIMGGDDPDFPDPAAEAAFQAKALAAKKLMIEGGGHHPQADSPDQVAGSLMEFFQQVLQPS